MSISIYGSDGFIRSILLPILFYIYDINTVYTNYHAIALSYVLVDQNDTK